MIYQVINLKNKKTKDAFLVRFIELNQLTFLPELGIEIRQVNEELIELFQKYFFNSESIKLLREEKSVEGLVVFRSINDLIDMKRKIMSTKNLELLTDLGTSIENFLSFAKKNYQVGNRFFSYNEPCLMGILNVTKDSFSDGGKYYESSAAIEHGLQLIEDGVDILDIGGESTRPGADEVTEDEEIKRIIPVIEGILKQKPGTLISVDTTKSKVAKAAIKSGAVMINDISGLTFDSKIAEVVSEQNAALVVMHIKGTPRTMQLNPSYTNLIGELYDHLYLQCKKAEKSSVTNIIIDPGIGFGKTVEHNFEILNRLEDFKSLGYPIMIGVSRKSFLGKTFNLEVTERDIPTLVTEAFALMNGASIIRTHNVKNVKQLLTIHKNIN